MQERVKVFTYRSDAGASLIETELEDHVNQWLQRTGGELISITQSESERHGQAHVTLCVWYRPEGKPQ